jgi:hypothetical protein
MDADLFVKVVVKVCRDGGVRSTLSNLRTAPDRIPTSQYVELSKWFTNLRQPDQEMVQQAVWLCAGHVLLSVLSVIDGAQAIESGPDKGHLELFYVKGDSRLLLNDRKKEPLNDKFRE